MKNHIKYSIVTIIVLAILMITQSVSAIPLAAPWTQAVPFDSSPTTHLSTVVGGLNLPNAYDQMYEPAAGATILPIGGGPINDYAYYYELKTFLTPSMVGKTDFSIGWVDFKMRYDCPGTTNDLYRIVYTVAPSATWIVLQDWTTAAASLGGSTIARAWALQTEPNDGVWDWTDIANIRFRAEVKKELYSSDWKNLNIYEAWVTVNPPPLPPTSSPTVSVQPPEVSGVRLYELFFVEVYAMDMPGLIAYQIVLDFDPSILQPVEAWSYYPWVSEVFPPVLDPSGFVSMSMFTFGGDPTGFVGSSPLARIYFVVIGGTHDSPLTLSVSKMSDPSGNPIPHPIYDGIYKNPIIMSADPLRILSPAEMADPMGTQWHELWPSWSKTHTVTSFEDNGDGYLSTSDQIDMYDETDEITRWYHVEEVTVTIHWTFKTTGEGSADPDPTGPPIEWPIGNPIGTRWHQVYPDWSRSFTITSWEDNGDIPGEFDPSDQFDFQYDDAPGVDVWAHLDAVSTDLILTNKPGPVSEFPLGISFVMLLAPIIPLGYLWRLRRKVKEQ